MSTSAIATSQPQQMDTIIDDTKNKLIEARKLILSARTDLKVFTFQDHLLRFIQRTITMVIESLHKK